MNGETRQINTNDPRKILRYWLNVLMKSVEEFRWSQLRIQVPSHHEIIGPFKLVGIFVRKNRRPQALALGLSQTTVFRKLGKIVFWFLDLEVENFHSDLQRALSSLATSTGYQAYKAGT